MTSPAMDFLDSVDDLPTIPKVVSQLLEAFRHENVDLRRVISLVSTDPAMAAQVLRLTNSAFYNRSSNITSIDDAIRFIGLNAVRTVVIGTALVGCVRCPPGFWCDMFWRYCLHTAVGARHFAKPARIDTETAFTAGLIHAIGGLVMYSAIPDRLGGVDARIGFFEAERGVVERAELGFNFSEVGAELLDRWEFPDKLIDAVRYGTNPLGAPEFSGVAGCVYLGGRIAALHERPTPVEEGEAVMPVLARLELAADALSCAPTVAELADGLYELIA